MDAIEKRARELYAQALRANGMEFSADRVGDMVESGAAGSQRAVLDAIIAALTPPEGYVLVPVDLLQVVAGCAYPVSTEIDPRGYAWSEAYLDQALPIIKAVLDASRQGVKP